MRAPDPPATLRPSHDGGSRCHPLITSLRYSPATNAVYQRNPQDAVPHQIVQTRRPNPNPGYRRLSLVTGIFRSSEERLDADLFNLVSLDLEAARRGQVAIACEPDSGTLVWVVEDGDEIVGFITADMNREKLVGEIRNNAIDPNRQSGGLGVQVYDFVLERMQEAGMKAVKVNTGADETPALAPARRAYEMAGFERSVPSVMYYGAT